MSNESYSLVLNSQNATNRGVNTTLSSISYNINWDTVLPRKYSQYSLNWQLKSNTTQTIQFFGAITTNNTLTLNAATCKFGTLYVGLQFLNPSSQVVTITGITSATVYTVSAGAGNDVINSGATLFYSINNQYLTNNLACSINFGKMMSVDQSNSQNSLIGFVYPSITPISANLLSYSYYASTLDNGNIQIAYPTNQTITVKFTNVDLVTAPSFFNDYSLQLYFTPIITDQEAINNTALLAGKF
jgi:hypothetical protein